MAAALLRSGWKSGAATLLVLCCAPAAFAQNDESELRRLQETVDAMQRQIDAQQRALDAQRQQIERMLADETEELPADDLGSLRGGGVQAIPPDRLGERPGETDAAFDRLMREADGELPALDLGEMRAGQAEGPPPPPPPTDGSTPPQAPTPTEPQEMPERAALPDYAAVLTSPGHFTLEPSIEYTNASANRLVFRGIEVVTGLQIGVIEASDVDRDTLSAAAAVRYGLADRLEVELRVPYVYRHDRILTLAQRDEQIIREFDLEGADLGDVEAAFRYQINRGLEGPIYLANLRIKSNTGTSPFEIERDEFGVLEELPTGSGFWAIEPGVTALIPSDPVVLYGNLSYIYHAPDDIDEIVGEAPIGQVDPGDSIAASLGFGFSLNQRFSFSLGYKHNYVYATETEFGATLQRSEPLQIGAMLMGLSYRMTDRSTASFNTEFGVTGDAPGARLTFRVPFAF